MDDPSIVHIARRMSRQLQLQKGMFMSPEAMQVLVECGAFDAVQSASTEFLRQQAVRSREEREQREAARYMPPGERRSQMHVVDDDAYFEDSRRHMERKLNGRNYSPESESEVLARARRVLGMKSAKPIVETMDPEVRESVERTQRMLEAKRQRQAERKAQRTLETEKRRAEAKRQRELIDQAPRERTRELALIDESVSFGERKDY